MTHTCSSEDIDKKSLELRRTFLSCRAFKTQISQQVSEFMKLNSGGWVSWIADFCGAVQWSQEWAQIGGRTTGTEHKGFGFFGLWWSEMPWPWHLFIGGRGRYTVTTVFPPIIFLTSVPESRSKRRRRRRRRRRQLPHQQEKRNQWEWE